MSCYPPLSHESSRFDVDGRRTRGFRAPHRRECLTVQGEALRIQFSYALRVARPHTKWPPSRSTPKPAATAARISASVARVAARRSRCTVKGAAETRMTTKTCVVGVACSSFQASFRPDTKSGAGERPSPRNDSRDTSRDSNSTPLQYRAGRVGKDAEGGLGPKMAHVAFAMTLRFWTKPT